MAHYDEQLQRVRRYYERFKKLNDGTVLNSPSEMYMDDVYAFFQNCYHLKDWLKNDPAFKKHNHCAIELYVNKTPALAICADICNGSKHLTLDSHPRSGSEPKMGKKVIVVNVTDNISGEESPTTIRINVEVEHAGQKLDAFELATDALRSWELFIN